MDCEEVGRILSENALDGLGPERRADLQAHLAACRACKDAWSAACESRELHIQFKELRGAASVAGRVMARIGGGPGRPSDGEGEEPPPPARIGGFEVLGTLGRGGMGTVLKARQTSTGRIVALKILPPRLARNEAFVTRFMREAYAAARLRHPNIVQGYDVGLAGGYYYFAMEYVDGEGLDALLARGGPLEPDVALRTMKQVCSALQAAHDAGIIHRDIKPSNILLDAQGVVRVTDFGLAKHTPSGLAAPPDPAAQPHVGAARDATATSQGQALGTPAYLAPEVAAGQPADARSDLYSLGATFFHVLTGRPPFEGASITELVLKQRDAEPPRLASACPRVDWRFCWIIDRLLRKKPDDRPASARAVLDALDALGPLQPVTRAARAGEPRRIRPGPGGYTMEQVRKGWAGGEWPPDYYRASVEGARRQARKDLRRTLWLAISAAGLMLLGLGIPLIGSDLDCPAACLALPLIPVGILRLVACAIAPGGISDNRWYVRRALYRHPLLKFLAFCALMVSLTGPVSLSPVKPSGSGQEHASSRSEKIKHEVQEVVDEWGEPVAIFVICIVGGLVLFIVSCEPGNPERH